MYYAPDDITFICVIGIFCVLIPLYLTVRNVMCLFAKKTASAAADIISILWGLFLSIIVALLFFNLSSLVDSDYDDQIYPHELHRPLHSEYGNIIIWILIFAVIALLVLCIFKPEKLSPIISAVSIALTIMGIAVFAFILIQLAANFNAFHMLVYFYFFNIIMIAVRRIRFHITEHVRLINERKTVFRFGIANKLYKIMSKVSGMTAFSFLLIFPIAAVFEIIFILLGQGPDGFIKAFTMTADWTFSTQTPPPPIEYEGHYLCTVAAGGHEKVVKPVRFGRRLRSRIVVNRQLLAANAFEDLIKEKLPRFHCAVRRFYDKYGYPVSRHITTPLRADIVYILMKPIEFIFVFVLYLCDNHPENRIAVQYSDYKKESH
ncbi:MAG: hypothetical protein IJX77_04700 [Ruminococcus sp.]|nr:hypothetical protein [Ruminococcus sp.]